MAKASLTPDNILSLRKAIKQNLTQFVSNFVVVCDLSVFILGQAFLETPVF